MAHLYGNWLGVLRWSLAQSDGTRPSEVKPMSEEDKTWLTSALQSMTINEAQRMGELGRVLAAREVPDDTPDAATRPPPSRRGDEPVNAPLPYAQGVTSSCKLLALGELQDYCESLDNAKDLFVVGGFTPLLAVVRDGPTARVRIAACETLSTVVQNNPKAQQWALEQGALESLNSTLLSLTLEGEAPPFHRSPSLRPDTPQLDCINMRAAALTALSSLVRSSGPGQAALVQSGGWVLVAAAVVEGVAPRHASGGPAVVSAQRRLVRKSLFFLRHLIAGTSSAVLSTALLTHPAPPGLLPALLAVLEAGIPAGGAEDDSEDEREHVLHILHALASPTPVVAGVVDDSGDRRRGVTGGIAVNSGGPRGGAAGGGQNQTTTTIETQPEALAAQRDAQQLQLAAPVVAAGEGAAVQAPPSSSTSEALMLLPETASSSGGGGGGADSRAAAAGSTEQVPELSLEQRRLALRTAAVLPALRRHSQWVLGRLAALPQGATGADADAEEPSVYVGEAEICAEAAAAVALEGGQD